jgi:hypothetical protein
MHRYKQRQLVKYARDWEGINLPSLNNITEILQQETKIIPQFYDCCKNSCVAYVGRYADLQSCPFKVKLPKGKTRPCGEPRYHPGAGRNGIRRPQKQYLYMPLEARLRSQYRDPERAKILSTYRAGFDAHKKEDELKDIFSGDMYHSYHRSKLGLFTE